MCGIVGLIYKDALVDRYNFTCMRDTLEHRGPDDADSEYYEGGRIALGQRRLSFLDLSSAGRQPMSNEDDTIWIVLNGEIYNYVELKVELEAAGHTFKNHTDTEVIIHGYEQWGEDIVNRMKGMFAFVILDLKKQQLFMARDHFGIKPLYYTITDKFIAFASELKAIVACKDVHPEVDMTSVADYMVYRYVPSPKTIWKGIHKLPPAHTLTFDYNTFEHQQNEYWQIKFENSNRDDAGSMVRNYGSMLGESVKIHARADVPIGSFLSGGYDSSAVVYYLTQAGYRPDTFSIGFEGWDNSEHQFAEMVAKKFNVPLNYFLAAEETLNLLDIMPDVYDEPIADISILPTWLVSHEAAKKVKAVMSGEGADELLGGYWWQKKLYADSYPEMTWKEKLARFVRGGKPGDGIDRLEFYAEANAMGRFNREELVKAFHPDQHASLPEDPEWFYRKHFDPSLSPLKSFQRMDIKCFMGELVLVKIDRASMASSLEVRVPFLDHDIFDYVLSAPETRYFRPEVTKYLLHDNIEACMPPEIMARPKQGFVGPDDFYIKIDRYRGILQDSRLVADKIIRREYVDEMLVSSEHWKLWKLAVLEGWYRRWVSDVPVTRHDSNVYVFVVCGAKEHTDTLQCALKALRKYSQTEIVVVTDSIRNEAVIEWDNIVDIRTPEKYDNHQASIYLKTGLHHFLPSGKLYCYLDTDVIAVNPTVDTVFEQYQYPITFAPDHCTMNHFSPAAVRCKCQEVYEREMIELQDVIAQLEKLPEGYYWEADFPDWTWVPEGRTWKTPSGHIVNAIKCPHLIDGIKSKFGTSVTNPEWQHWNGGVFLFDDDSRAFLETWHRRTLEIFEDSAWKTRDQGTLISTVWEYGLQDAPTMSRQFNLILDYNYGDKNKISEDGKCLAVDESGNMYEPMFAHVYHHFGDTSWDLWNWVVEHGGL